MPTYRTPNDVKRARLVATTRMSDNAQWRLFVHAASKITQARAGQRIGYSVWECPPDDELAPLGIAFEWLEIRPGVPVMLNPAGILTNILFVDACMQLHARWEMMPHDILFELPWQETLNAQVLRARRPRA